MWGDVCRGGRVGNLLAVEEVEAGVGAEAEVVVLAGAVDAREWLLLVEAREAMARGHLHINETRAHRGQRWRMEVEEWGDLLRRLMEMHGEMHGDVGRCAPPP